MSIIHLDPTKPADLNRLIATGMIWSPAVPIAYKQMAIEALVAGTAEPSATLPPSVIDEVNRLRNGHGRPPLELPGDPEGDADADD